MNDIIKMNNCIVKNKRGGEILDVKKILSKITEIYIFFIILVFPICVDNTRFF